MATSKIVGIVLIKNEDLHVERVIRNIAGFCDRIIIADNQSEDHTFEIVNNLAKEFTNIDVTQVHHPRESHKIIEHCAGTDTWIFAVDGDEIYDPNGLVKMRSKILNGEFANTWAIFGNVLNCIELNFKNCTTKGYLAPPCRSMTKLYNFSLIESWTGCPERLHGGELIFKNKESHELRRYLHTEYDWDDAYFRCIHTVFIPRSSLEKNKRRRNPFEMEQIQNIHKQNFSLGYFKLILKSFLGLDWKNQKYRRGKLVEKDISAFL